MKELVHGHTWNGKVTRFAALAALIVICCLCGTGLLAASTISYVQSAYADPQTPQTTVNVTFTGAQTAGDLNVVVVGWNDTTATVSSVTDSKGNVYTRAVGPTTISGSLSQSIYYAKNIVAAAAGSNTVTVTFSTAAVYPDIRVLEYSGADPNNPVDVTAANSGTGTSSSSGSVTTTNATDLLFGANTVTSVTSGPGSGYTNRVITSPDGDIAEDQVVTSTGSYSATAPISSGTWIMQMVAFRTPSGGGGSFTISASPASLSITQGNQGTSTITTTVSGGFNNAIALSATGVPSGTTVSFNPSTIPAPGSGTSTMTITVGASTPTGTYPITVSGNGGGVQQNTTVTLTVTGAATFTLSASPASLSVRQGNQGTSTITTAISGGFNSSIALSSTGAPSGTTVSFNPSTIPAPGSGTSTMTITVGTTTPTGTYPITVTGNGGGVQQNTTVTLTVVSNAASVTYIQSNYADPQTSQTTVNVTFTAAQTAGDLNVVVVGWNDSTRTVNSVTDSKGNVYTRAVGPTTVSGYLSQSIYYAKNIAAAAAGSNTVTVTFSAAATYPDVRILEYGGADPSNPVDVTAAGSGNSNSSSSGSATTTNPTDLIFGADTVVTISGTGTGFTRRILTSPDGDIAEDEMVTSAGSYSATAPVVPSGRWIMQMVAFRSPSGGGGSFTIAASPGSLTIVQGNQGTSTITTTATGGFNSAIALSASGVPSGTTVSFNPSTIPAPGSGTSTMTITVGVSTAAGTYPITVTGNGGGVQQNTTVTLTVTTPPTFTLSASPASLSIADGSQGTSTITTAVSGGFNSAIALSAAGAPSGTTIAFNPTTIPAPGAGSSTMTIMVGASTPTGTYPITVTGTGGGVQQNTTVTLTVTQLGISPPTNVNVTDGGPAPIIQAVQSYINSTYLTVHTTQPFDSSNGDLIVMFASSHAGVTMTPSDAYGNTWVTIAVPTNTIQGFDLRSQIWYVANPTTGPNETVSVTLSAPQSFVMSIFVLKGSNISSPIDAISLIGSDNGTQSENVASPSINTSMVNDLLLGWVKVSAGATFTSGPGFTQQPGASSNFLDAESGTAATPGAYDATFTISSPQTWQSAVVAAYNNTNQTALTWTASTDSNGTIAQYLIERCQGMGCNNFVQIGTSTTTTYYDDGLAPSTNYSYRLRAEDTMGNLGPYSSVVAITLPPTIPSLPGDLTTNSPSQSEIDLAWVPSTETNGTIAQYLVERCPGANCTNFAQIGTTANSSYQDLGLTAGSTYTYRVRAQDSAGNRGPYSNVASGTTLLPANVAYVQGNYATPQTPQTTVSVTYSAAQSSGDLNVVVVGWNDSTANVASVVDSKGNAYTLAVGPTIVSGTLSQAIYYSPDIATATAGTNTVTVTFSSAAAYPDVRILEYAGAAQTNPVDVTAASSGNSNSSSSGSATTTNPADLLFGANMVVTTTTGPGTGFTSRLLTVPDSDIAEDEMVGTTGSYSATAPLSSSGAWIMQMVAFKASANNGPVLQSISVTPTNPSIMIAGQQQFTATGNYSDGSHQNLTDTASWTSSLPSVATINSTGLATGVTAGSTTIQASMNGVNGSTTLVVTSTFLVTPRAAVITFTQTQQFNATSGFGSVTWSVDGIAGGNPTVGTISTSGLYAPPPTVGSHTITATTSQQQANASVYVSNYAGTFTYHNDNLRTGQNNDETVLTTANVNQHQFGKLFSFPLDGIAFASPLYVQGVSIPGQGVHNVVYVATENDSIYAFDADGLSNSALWHVSFLGTGVTTIPCGDTGECGDIPVQIGITGTPVIDPTTNTMYVVVNTKENGTNYYQRLHAIDITTGAEKFGGPVVISGSVPGTGDGSSGGVVPFIALNECQRPGLLLNNGVVYIGWGSHGDNHPWHGWIIGYNAATLQQVMIYNVTPNGYGGGVWQGGDGLATDATGDIYFTTSNGPFDVNTGGNDYGDTVEKISPSGTVVDYFTPYDQQNDDVNNLDLGAGGPVLLVDQPTSPYPHELISAGKSGTIYVVNRDNMGHYNPNNDNQIIQSLPGVLPHGDQEVGNFSTPVYFNGHVYFAAVNDYLKAFQLTNGLLSTSPSSQSAVIYPVRGGSFAISSNGTSNGILWAIQNNGQSPDNDTGAPGVLYAYDATNLANELYDSSQAGSRDTLDYAAKFAIPVVANGKVFVAGQSQLTAFGLLP